MSSFLTNAGTLGRGISVLPDIGNQFDLGSPVDLEQPISFPEAVPQSDLAKMRTVQLDAAIEMNRLNTAPEVVQQRAAPRYSVRGLNSLDEELLARRLNQIDKNDNRPGLMKVLDVLDLPRNFVQGAITEHFIPEAKRMAEERGDYDQFGNLKVFGSDLLRGMGVENRVINAIGGFAIDIFTDPLSFIGGPIGGLTQTTGRGAVQLSNKGSRLIRSSINNVSKGKTIANSFARETIESTLEAGVRTGVLEVGADSIVKSQFLRDQLLGSSTKTQKAIGKFGLGRITTGGLIAEDTFKALPKLPVGAVEDATQKSVSRRIVANKAFARQFANNSGLDLARRAGGAEILHVPLTSKTVTAPAFNIPGFGHRFGGRAEMQVAASHALRGNIGQSTLILKASAAATRLSKIQSELDEVAGLRAQTIERASTQSEIVDAASSMAVIDKRADDLAKEIRVIRADIASIEKLSSSEVAATISNPNSLADVLVMADSYDDALASLRKAELNERFMIDDQGRVGAQRITRARTTEVRQAQEALRKEAAARDIGTAETFAEELTSPEMQSDAFAEMVSRKRERSSETIRDYITANEADLDAAETMADTFQGIVEANQKLAFLRGADVRKGLTSEQRHIADGARMAMGISDQQLGTIPFQSFDSFMQSAGQVGMASRMNELGRSVAKNFGANKGVLNDVFRNLSDGVTHQADEKASHTLRNVVQRIERAVNRAPNVKGSDIDDVYELAFLRVEQYMIEKAAEDGLSDFARRASVGTKMAREKLEYATRTGLLADDAMRTEIDGIAKDVAESLLEMGKDAVIRGDLTDPLAVYVPVMLKQEAAKRAELLRRGGNHKAAELLDIASGPGNLDPTKRRITNMIEFDDLEGNPHRFTIAEGDAYRAIDDGTLLDLEERGLKAQADNARRVRESVEQFRKSFGITNGTHGDALLDIMKSNSRPMLASELNEYNANGNLRAIVGGNLGELGGDSIFETSLPNILYSRSRAHEIARAKESFRDVIEPFIVIDSVQRAENASVAGARGTLTTGEEFITIGDGSRIRVGRNTLRRISDIEDKLPHDTALSVESLLRGKHKDGYIPEQMAVQIERLGDRMRPEPMNEVMRQAEKLTSLFRTTTLMHPSWAVTNTVGNMFLASMMGLMDPQRIGPYSKYLKDAFKIHTQHNLEALSQKSVLGRVSRKTAAKIGFKGDDTINVAGAPLKVSSILDEIGANGVAQTISGDQADILFNSVARGFPGLQTQPKTAVGRSFRQSKGIAEARQSGSSRLSLAGNTVAAASKSIPATHARNAVKTWFQINSSLDQIFRTAAYLTLRNEGSDPLSAASQVRRGMLNFGDLSSFESNTIRPIIPFYSWVKASLPNIAVRSIKDPKILSSVPKITQGLEALTAGEDRVPQHMRPRWLQETMAIQLGTDPETRGAFLLGTLLPQEGALQALSGVAGAVGLFTDAIDFDGQDFLDGVNWAAGQTSPVFRAPVELALQKETFSGRSIGVEKGDGDITLNEYLTNQIRPIKEFGLGVNRGKVAEAFDRSALEGTSRLLVGGRLQPGLQAGRLDTANFFDMKEKEVKVRKAIRLAEKEGDEERGVKMRFKLLEIYKRFVDKGGDTKDIPRWAAGDLQRFAK